MAEETTQTEKSEKKESPAAAAIAKLGARNPKWSRKNVKAHGRAKRKLRLAADKEFAKSFFEARSKRSVDKKSAYRKKKKGKK
jgi:hypothetical protein